jgi:hypothetical protein
MGFSLPKHMTGNQGDWWNGHVVQVVAKEWQAKADHFCDSRPGYPYTHLPSLRHGGPFFHRKATQLKYNDNKYNDNDTRLKFLLYRNHIRQPKQQCQWGTSVLDFVVPDAHGSRHDCMSKSFYSEACAEDLGNRVTSCGLNSSIM